MYLLDRNVCGLSGIRYITIVMPEMCFVFRKKKMKEIYAYVQEFMLTFDKMQKTSPLIAQSSVYQVFWPVS